MEFKFPRRGLHTALTALWLASGCDFSYNRYFDADTKPHSPEDGDRLEIFPPAAAITADTTSEMSKVELSVFGATEDGVPSESAHINVFIGACGDGDSDEVGAGSPLELVPL